MKTPRTRMSLAFLLVATAIIGAAVWLWTGVSVVPLFSLLVALPIWAAFTLLILGAADSLYHSRWRCRTGRRTTVGAWYRDRSPRALAGDREPAGAFRWETCLIYLLLAIVVTGAISILVLALTTNFPAFS